LFDIDDAFIGDDPDIEEIIDPDKERVEPDNEHERVFDEEREALRFGAQPIRIQDRQKREAAKEKRQEYCDDDEMSEDIEPMPMNDAEYRLALALALEVVTAEIVIRHSLEIRGNQERIDRKAEKEQTIRPEEYSGDDHEQPGYTDGELAIQ
jgi:hypothetical protein